MTLRTRLLLAGAAFLAAVIVALVVVAQRQEQFLVEQIDQTLERVSERAASTGVRVLPPTPARATETGNLYIGVDDGDRLVTLGAPGGDRDLEPLLDALRTAPVGEAVRVATVDGREMRVITTEVDAGRLVVGQSTASVDDAIARLRLSAVVATLGIVGVAALVGSWVNRLGLRPIRAATEVASAIAEGRRDERVPELSGATEAATLGTAMNLMLDTTAETEQRLRTFVADASHELRTPLTTLMGYADLHQQGVLDSDEQVDDAMRRIRSEAKRMSRIVEQLFLLARFDEGTVSVQPEPVDVAQLLDDLAADAGVVQPDRMVAVEIEGPLSVVADPDLLWQAASVIVTNALTHSPVSAAITLTAERVADDVVIAFHDGGPGIAPEHLDRLFERFYRVDPGRSRANGGSGLGLSIARSIIEAHGGTIEVESAPGRGTTFTMHLPPVGS